jgi:uncharacterized protein
MLLNNLRRSRVNFFSVDVPKEKMIGGGTRWELSFVGYMILSFPILAVMSAGVARLNLNTPEEEMAAMTNPITLGVNPNLFLILLLLGYVGGMVGLYVAVKFLHQKAFVSIITSAKKIRWKRVGFAALIWFLLFCINIAIAISNDPLNFQFSFQLQPFLITLAIAIVFLPAQTWWEEFLFRGYIMQGIAQTRRTAVLPIVITSLLFGLLHFANPEVTANGFWYSMPMYILPGLLFAVIGILDGGLEIPMGFHFANNLFGTVILTNDVSAIQASTVFRQSNPDFLVDVLGLIQIPVIFILFWRIYKWDFKKIYK